MLTLVGGCATHPPIKLEALKTSVATELTEVPFFSQRRQQCGAAALATVLAYRQVNTTAKALENYLYIPDREGTLTTEIVGQARRHNMLVHHLEPSLEAIIQEVAAKNPILVMQNLGFTWLPQWHFAVVVGYDLHNKHFILRSGKQRTRQIDFATFYATWQRADHWAVVIAPPTTVPATVRYTAFVKAATEFEEIGKTKVAQTAYLTALEHWPNNDLESAYIGLSNLAYGDNNFITAKNWLRLAINSNPESAASWNNLAYIMIQLACPVQAKQAINCALKLDPDNINYQSSQKEITLKADTLNSGQTGIADINLCVIPAC